METARKTYNYVNDGLKKIQQQEWAEPVGKALAVSGQICDTLGNFIPGLGMVGGALSVGASLLNPEPSIEDLQNELLQMKETMSSLAEQNVTSKGRENLEYLSVEKVGFTR